MSAVPPRLGPGRLILVVGPSGAGKDALIRAARDTLAGDDRFVFPRRTVTRPASAAEDNDAVDEATFGRAAAGGAFAVHWEAHGLRYGVPAAIDHAIRGGRQVVCNVSRTVVAGLRERYADVLVIEITAPPAILEARLAARARPEDGDPARRLARSTRIEPVRADTTLTNSGTLAEGCAAFLEAIAADHDRAALRPGAELSATATG